MSCQDGGCGNFFIRSIGSVWLKLLLLSLCTHDQVNARESLYENCYFDISLQHLHYHEVAIIRISRDSENDSELRIYCSFLVFTIKMFAIF